MIPGKSEKSVKTGNNLIGILLAKATPRLGGPSWGGIYSGKHPPKGCPPWGVAPMATKGILDLWSPLGEGNTALGEGSLGGVSPPMAPPNIHLMGVLVGFASRFADNLE